MSRCESCLMPETSGPLYRVWKIFLCGLCCASFLRQARALVAEQAADEGLWFHAETAPEAYLQEALRKLHTTIIP